MEARHWNTFSGIFAGTFLLLTCFWIVFSVYAPIPDANVIYLETVDGTRTVGYLWWFGGRGTDRLWFDLMGIPLLTVSTFAAVRLLQYTWAFLDEIWNYIAGAVIFAIVLSILCFIFGAYVGFTILMLGLVLAALGLVVNFLIRLLDALLKKQWCEFTEFLERTGLFLFVTVPLGVSYTVALVQNGLYGYIVYIAYCSAAFAIALLLRSFSLGTRELYRRHLRKKKIAYK